MERYRHRRSAGTAKGTQATYRANASGQSPAFRMRQRKQLKERYTFCTRLNGTSHSVRRLRGGEQIPIEEHEDHTLRLPTPPKWTRYPRRHQTAHLTRLCLELLQRKHLKPNRGNKYIYIYIWMSYTGELQLHCVGDEDSSR